MPADCGTRGALLGPSELSGVGPSGFGTLQFRALMRPWVLEPKRQASSQRAMPRGHTAPKVTPPALIPGVDPRTRPTQWEC